MLHLLIHHHWTQMNLIYCKIFNYRNYFLSNIYFIVFFNKINFKIHHQYQINIYQLFFYCYNLISLIYILVNFHSLKNINYLRILFYYYFQFFIYYFYFFHQLYTHLIFHFLFYNFFKYFHFNFLYFNKYSIHF